MNFEYDQNDVDESKPLIYAWFIKTPTDCLRYVGKSENGAERPLKHYARNVDNLLAGKPYRGSNPDGYRKVHRALADAVENDWSITLRLVENVAENESIFLVERIWRNRLKAGLNASVQDTKIV